MIFSVLFQESMFLACLTVLQDGVEIDIRKGMEDIAGDLAVRLRELRD